MPKRIHILQDKESYNFGLIGISTPENDYRICWILNNSFEYKLVRLENLEIYHKKLEDSQAFPQFSYYDEETLLLYRLISNRCENGYLLEEMVNIDYLIQISGEYDKNFIEKQIRNLNKMEEITIAFQIDPATLKSRKKLLI